RRTSLSCSTRPPCSMRPPLPTSPTRWSAATTSASASDKPARRRPRPRGRRRRRRRSKLGTWARHRSRSPSRTSRAASPRSCVGGSGGGRGGGGRDGAGPISGVAPLEAAGPSQIAFYANPRYRKELLGTRAAAVIVSEDDAAHVPAGSARLVAAQPYVAFAKA